MHLYAIWAILLVGSSSALASLDAQDEESHLLSIFPANEDHHVTLQKLLSERSSCELLKYHQIEGAPIDVLCNAMEARDMKKLLRTHQLPFTSSRTVIDESQPYTEEVEVKEPALNQHIGFNKYNRYDNIQKYMKDLADTYSNFVELKSASVEQSHERRNLNYLKIGTSPDGPNTKMVWIDAGIHAREWISVSTALYTIDKLVRVFKKQSESITLNEKEQEIVKVDWLVMPLLNPDGYEYSHFNKSREIRLWRKNRSPQADNCFGVDLNRNFDVVGYGTGHEWAISHDPCESAYVGTMNSTEQEIKMVSEVVMANKDKIKVALSLHCYGSFILTPYAYTNATPSDSDQIVEFGNRLYSAIKTISPDRKYIVGASGKLFFYTAGGSSLDYFKATAGIPYVATIELPGNYTNGTKFPEQHGFHSPVDQLLLVGQEIWAAMFEAAKTAYETSSKITTLF